MSHKQQNFSLEVNNIEGDLEIFLRLDDPSLELLISELRRLKTKGDHTHYMSEKWGGVSLTTQVSNQRHEPAHHFQITKV